MPIAIRNDQAIKKIAIAGNIIFEIFGHIDTMDLNGMQTIELNDRIHTIIKKHSATPAFLNYRGFPKSACVSLNNEVVHGIPGKRTIQDGDLVKIDVGVNYQGYIADAAKTFAVGVVSDSAKKLMAVTKQALRQGIAQVQKGKRISDISRAVQTVVENNGFSVVRDTVVGENTPLLEILVPVAKFHVEAAVNKLVVHLIVEPLPISHCAPPLLATRCDVHTTSFVEP